MSIREINEPMANQATRRAVIYARVSSKEQARGYSIQAQLELLRPYGAQNCFVIDEEFTDVETAKKAGRPGFNAMLRHLEKNTGCRVILVEKTDRLYRNLTDAGRVEEMGIEVHLVKPGQVISKVSGAADTGRDIAQNSAQPSLHGGIRLWWCAISRQSRAVGHPRSLGPGAGDSGWPMGEEAPQGDTRIRLLGDSQLWALRLFVGG
jgi:hypothetical protein